MNDKTKSIIQTTLIASVVGVGALLLIAKYRKTIYERIRSIWKNEIKKEILIINSPQECNLLIQRMRQHCNKYNVLGFDCEWLVVNNSRRPVALVQLATSEGLIGLFRLSEFVPKGTIPNELRDILEDSTIIKAGVSPQNDARLLFEDYSIRMNGTIDLRWLALRVDEHPAGLAKMSKKLLDIELDKHWKISCSDWEATNLSPQQVQYAANDAFCGVEIFKKLFDKIKQKPSMKDIIEHCEEFVDKQFKNKSAKSLQSDDNLVINRKVKDVNKMIKRAYAVRQKPLYDNCYLEAPDGDALCTIEKKKAEWYIHKGLGTEISKDPYVVRLNFEPTGRAVGDVGRYYLTPKDNKCVVCASIEHLIRKNVVPREYRKYFPIVMKDHTSHDVLLLCSSCHQFSNMTDLKLRHALEKLCDAPLKVNLTQEQKEEISKEKDIQKMARALFYCSEKIPTSRVEELRSKLKNLYPDQELTNEFLKDLIENPVQIAIDQVAHGEQVVNYFKKNGGLVELEKMWRQHFLDTMNPKHMPELWSVEHNADRLEIRATEGRVEQEDLKIAGLNIVKKGSNDSSQSQKNGACHSSRVEDASSSETEFKSFSDSSFKNGSDDTLKDDYLSDMTMPSHYETIKSDSSTLDYSDFKSFDASVTEKIKYESDDSNSTLSQPSSTLESDDDSEIREIESRDNQESKTGTK